MYQNYNYYNPNTPNGGAQQNQINYLRQVQSNFLKGRPVSSIEEARAMTIDFDGSVFYFPDMANKRIYTKQINMDGTASLNMYELKEIPTESIAATENVAYVTREEFESVIQQLRSALLSAPQPQPQQPAEPKPQEKKTELKPLLF